MSVFIRYSKYNTDGMRVRVVMPSAELKRARRLGEHELRCTKLACTYTLLKSHWGKLTRAHTEHKFSTHTEHKFSTHTDTQQRHTRTPALDKYGHPHTRALTYAYIHTHPNTQTCTHTSTLARRHKHSRTNTQTEEEIYKRAHLKLYTRHIPKHATNKHE